MLRFFLFLFVIVYAAPSVSWAQQSRVALVFGNGAYREVPQLPNPPNDSQDIAAAFKRLGFDVRLVGNADYDSMRKALLEFSAAARASEIAVVYYAGHGIEAGGENWLIPVDARLQTDATVDQEAISLKSVMFTVANASKFGLVILDACRNNPFAAKMQRSLRTRAVDRGLAKIEPSASVLVAYAARDGTTALDGDGRNSPFTTALLNNLEVPGLEINFLFRNVRDDVIINTNRAQEPFLYGSLSRNAIYFRELSAQPGVAEESEIAWSFVKNSKEAETLRRFAFQYSQSPHKQDALRRADELEKTSGPTTSLKKYQTCFKFNNKQICE